MRRRAELLNSDLQVRCITSVYPTSGAGLLLFERKQCNDQYISLDLQRVKAMKSAYILGHIELLNSHL